MLDKLVYLLSLSALAVVYADVLVRPGMLLEPLQRWVRQGYNYKLLAWWHRKKLGGYEAALLTAQAWPRDLDSQWWWKPLWGCYICVSGWAGLLGYLARYWRTYNLFEHLAFTAFTIIAAIILAKWTREY